MKIWSHAYKQTKKKTMRLGITVLLMLISYIMVSNKNSKPETERIDLDDESRSIQYGTQKKRKKGMFLDQKIRGIKASHSYITSVALGIFFLVCFKKSEKNKNTVRNTSNTKYAQI